MLRSIWLIARSVLIEAIRRREIYVIVLISTLLIAGVMAIDFFQLEGLTKFYREIALMVMSAATALTVIVLSSRQLPREFERRTIYPLLARPVSRWAFLLGKLGGVMLAAAFCFALFMLAYVAGTLYLGGDIPWMLFLQYIYLQLFAMLILATLCFWLSMFLNLDAAITIGILFYAFAAALTNVLMYLYGSLNQVGQWLVVYLNYALPQLTLFDLSAKTVHADEWGPLGWDTLGMLTAYGLSFAASYFVFALLCFQRRAL